MGQLKTIKLMIRLDEETNQMIEKLATRNKTTKSQVIRQALLGLYAKTYRNAWKRTKDPISTSETKLGGIK